MKLLGAFFQEGAEEASPPADTRAIDRCRRGLDACFPAHRGTRTMVTRVERCRCATNDSDVSWRGTEWSGNLPCCARSGIVDSLRRRPIGEMDDIFEFESNFENRSFREEILFFLLLVS